MSAKELVDDVLSRAISELRERRVDVFTFAFYHDHESGAVSICVDTKDNSEKSIRRQNVFWNKYFREAIAEGNLNRAAKAPAHVDRNFELGDFATLNVARTKIGRVKIDDDLYLAMIRAIQKHESEIKALSSKPDCLVFCASSAK